MKIPRVSVSTPNSYEVHVKVEDSTLLCGQPAEHISRSDTAEAPTCPECLAALRRFLPGISFTAWELAGDWWWVTAGFVAVSTLNGRAEWETATAKENGKVCMARADADLISRTDYVYPDDTYRLRRPTP